MLSLIDVKNWCRVSHDDDDATLQMLLATAYIIIENSVTDYNINMISPKFENLVNLQALLIVKDLYDNREYLEEKKRNYSLVSSNLWLKMEYGTIS